jgi:hypothetical protein
MPEQESNYTYEGQGYNNQDQPSDSFLREMIDVEKTLESFKMEVLRREKVIVDLKKKERRVVPIANGINPICNDLGIAEIMGFIRAHVTTLARLTKKTDEEIMKDMFIVDRGFTETISLRADDWELDEDLTKKLHSEVINLIWDVKAASRNGFTAMNLKTQYSRHEQSNAQVSGDSEIKSILGMKIR